MQSRFPEDWRWLYEKITLKILVTNLINSIKTQTRTKLCYGSDVCHLKAPRQGGWFLEELNWSQGCCHSGLWRGPRDLTRAWFCINGMISPLPCYSHQKWHSQEGPCQRGTSATTVFYPLDLQRHKPLLITYSECLRHFIPVMKKHPNTQTFRSSNTYREVSTFLTKIKSNK